MSLLNKTTLYPAKSMTNNEINYELNEIYSWVLGGMMPSVANTTDINSIRQTHPRPGVMFRELIVVQKAYQVTQKYQLVELDLSAFHFAHW